MPLTEEIQRYLGVGGNPYDHGLFIEHHVRGVAGVGFMRIHTFGSNSQKRKSTRYFLQNDPDLDVISTRHDRAGARGDDPGAMVWIDVQCEAGVSLDQSFLDHGVSTARSFFPGLEHETHATAQFGAATM